MEDQWFNDYLVVCIEKDVTDSINNEAIINNFKYEKLIEGNCRRKF